MKIISFNVNGIRAIAKKNFHQDMRMVDADVICLQETKSTVEQAKEVTSSMEGYHFFGNESKARKGYSGTAILSKIKPISHSIDIGIEEHDQEGRVTTLEFEDFYLVTSKDYDRDVDILHSKEKSFNASLKRSIEPNSILIYDSMV